jgi:hypothetical protein
MNCRDFAVATTACEYGGASPPLAITSGSDADPPGIAGDEHPQHRQGGLPTVLITTGHRTPGDGSDQREPGCRYSDAIKFIGDTASKLLGITKVDDIAGLLDTFVGNCVKLFADATATVGQHRAAGITLVVKADTFKVAVALPVARKREGHLLAGDVFRLRRRVGVMGTSMLCVEWDGSGSKLGGFNARQRS